MSNSSPRAERLAALRAQVRAIEAVAAGEDRAVLPFDIDEVDRRLAGGGLPFAALHEVAAASPHMGDDAASVLFTASLAARLARARPGMVLWAFTRLDLFPPGLAGAGLTPDRILYAECRDDEEVLAVMEDGLRYGGLRAMMGEVGRATMASVRRLQLAAEQKGTTALLLRRWRKGGDDPLGAPSSAVTRWRIGCAPSAPLPFEGLGRARWRVALLRQRGGPPCEWILEAPDAEARFALPARSGDRQDQAITASSIAVPTRAHAA